MPESEIQTNKDEYYKAIANLQQKSKEPNTGRWGDNIHTLLQFAKPVPDKAGTIARYQNMHYVDFNMDMQAKYYGKTWEEFVKAARQKVEPIEDETDEQLLKRAFNLEIQSKVGVYTVDE